MEQTGEGRICRKCLLIDSMEGKEKEIVYRYISELPKSDKASQQEFENRLNTCRSCEQLSMATCQACGCFVEVRAAVKKKKCPNRKW